MLTSLIMLSATVFFTFLTLSVVEKFRTRKKKKTIFDMNQPQPTVIGLDH
ncbi:hypothetical protein [Aquibacillus saliphilus]|nr:hypothetical protein [Aquibacillus saliphilus]